MVVKRALSGIRVLDFSRAIAGPYATLFFADMGAEVIKVEQVPSQINSKTEAMDADWATLFGYPIVETGPSTPESRKRLATSSSHFQSLNRNKKRIALNLESEKGREVFHDLVKKSDVVFDNFRPALAKQLGIDFETLRKVNPRIISCSLSGYGETGPWSDAPAYDVVLQALGGEMSMTGLPDCPPCRSGIPIGDLVGGAFSTIGILIALRARDLNGVGQRIDLSMLDVQISLLNYRIGQFSATGAIPGPVGSGHSGMGQIPYGAYECQDKTYIVIAAGGPRHWRSFITAIGLPELVDDPRFNTNAKRQDNADTVTGLIDGMLLTRTAQEWEKIFFDAKIPAGVVNDVSQAIRHPQVLHRNMVVSVEQSTGEKLQFAGNPIKINGQPESFKAAPEFAADTKEILSKVAGYSKEHIDALVRMDAVYVPEK